MIEDNPVDVFLIKSLLSKIPHIETHLVFEPSLDLGISRLRSDTFDIVVLDLSLTDSWGLDTLFKVRSFNPNIPIIVITSHDDEEWGIDALKNGAQDYIIKNQLTAASLKRTIQFAIERENYYKNIKDKAKELEMLNQINRETAKKFETMAHELLKRLSKVAQARDLITGAHTERVGIMASMIANAAGLSKEESGILRQVAPLHDLGKVGIPDRILLKPDSLNTDEWEIMKNHTLLGYDLLSNSAHPALQKAALIALTHHEKWNGTGYPKKLSGTEIPIEGRIVGLVDVFDALTSNRPYKKAWHFRKAFDYIEENSDIAFDPEIVAIFLEKKEEILTIKENQKPSVEESS
jgi:putative two-component system response regulator